MSEFEIFKFGGSCLKESNDVDAIVQRVRESESERTIVVVSAFYGVTDRIIERLERNDEPTIPAFVASIEMAHLEMSQTLVDGFFSKKFQEAISSLSSALKINCEEASVQSRTAALIAGERISSVAIAAILLERGIDSAPAWAEEIGIQIHQVKGESVINIEETMKSLTLPPVRVPVVTGWYGQHDDSIAVLARGGSDLTATSLAAVVNASEVTIWRDVPGVLALSPRWSIPSRNLPYLSYTEAQELALFSEPMLHPFAVEPLRKEGIPLRLRPLHDPNSAGSCIGPSVATGEPRVRAVGCLPHLVPLTLNLSGVMSVAKVVGDATMILERARIRVWSLRARPNEARFLVSERFASRAIRLISESPRLPTPERGSSIAILCLVGESIGLGQAVSGRIELLADESDLEFTHLDEGKRAHALHYTVSDSQTQRALLALAKHLDLLVS
jgi:aspartate kinase